MIWLQHPEEKEKRRANGGGGYQQFQPFPEPFPLCRPRRHTVIPSPAQKKNYVGSQIMYKAGVYTASDQTNLSFFFFFLTWS